MTLSWKVGLGKSSGEKRHQPITFEGSPQKSAKTDRPIYAPPRDKYSRGAGQFGELKRATVICHGTLVGTFLAHRMVWERDFEEGLGGGHGALRRLGTSLVLAVLATLPGEALYKET